MSPCRPRTRRNDEVLVRGPWLTDPAETGTGVIDSDAQLAELTALYEDGLLSAEEYERQKRKVADH